MQEFSQLLDSDAIAQDLSQLLAAADAAFVTPMNAKMVLIGFSQGGIIIGKYLVHAGDTAPDRLLVGNLPIRKQRPNSAASSKIYIFISSFQNSSICSLSSGRDRILRDFSRGVPLMAAL